MVGAIFGGRVSGTILNMTAHGQTEAERVSRVVFDYAARIVSEQNSDRLLQLNADLARDLTGADRCSIWLIDEQRGQLWTKVAHGSGDIRIPLGRGVVGACVEKNEPILINDSQNDPRFHSDVDRGTGYVTQSIVTLPLRRPDGIVIGALQVLNKPGGFSASDVMILGLASTYAASNLDSQRLREEAESARMLYRELEIARDVQSKLFPQNIPALPGIAYNAFCRPAKFVGGDYYDFLPMVDGCLVFTLGDVSGKGIAAAMLMASIQSSLRTQLLRPPDSIGRLLTDLNKAVHASSTADKYTTLFCGMIDPAHTTLTYVNAAHVSPLLIRNGTITKLDPTGMPLGMFGHVTYEQSSVAIEPGDLIVVFSDGITECANGAGDFWDEADMERAAISCAGVEVVDKLVHEADRFAGGAEQSDDMTVVAIRIASS